MAEQMAKQQEEMQKQMQQMMLASGMGTGGDRAAFSGEQAEDGGYVGGGGLASSKQMKTFEEKLNKLQTQVDDVSTQSPAIRPTRAVLSGARFLLTSVCMRVGDDS